MNIQGNIHSSIHGNTKLLGIIGNPLSHSYSPAMHNAAIAQLGLDLVYVPLRVEMDGLESCLRVLRELEFVGVNVTIPYKQTVIPHLDEISDLSRKIGAVNTIVVRHGKLFGTTTDAEGFLAGFREAGHRFDGKSVMIFGNGGSARTLAFALLLMVRTARVAIAARDRFKSETLAADIREKTGMDLEVLNLEDYPKHKSDFDILVHTTSVGMHPNIDESLLSAEHLQPNQIVYDLIYNPEETTLMRIARDKGCQVVGGLGMLVHQGIASFKLWTGVDPDPASFYAGIREQQKLARMIGS